MKTKINTNIIFSKAILSIALLCAVFQVNAEVTLPTIFSDHMVLQQNEEVTIWGWAEPSESIELTTSWSDIGVTATANSKGEWKVNLRTPSSTKGQSMTITAKNSIVIEDILIGEVWMCSGQSNMVWPIGNLGTNRAAKDISEANYPDIRLFTVKQSYVTEPADSLIGNGKWMVCSPETVSKFSATGYYFGMNIHRRLNQPVGLISSNVGGTPAKAWMSKEALQSFGGFEKELAFVNSYTEMKEVLKKENELIRQKWESNIDSMDMGITQAWYNDLNDSKWSTMNLPGTWKNTPLEEVDGMVWFRKSFQLNKKQINDDLEIHLGSIDDIDNVWINGIEIGHTIGWKVNRHYTIPKIILNKGTNQIAVRVIDHSNEGGFRGEAKDMNISLAKDRKTIVVKLAGDWKYKTSCDCKLTKPESSKKGLKRGATSVLYNGMISPIKAFTVAGVIWYQGETDSPMPIRYRTLFPALINDWRKQFQNPDLPFYYVQIAPFKYKPNTAAYALREAQFLTDLPNTGMAVTMDIGKRNDIHPRNKHDVGDRLARWALAKTYGFSDVKYSGPVYKSMETSNNKAILYFDYAEQGLKAGANGLSDFQVAGADGVFYDGVATIDGATVIVSSDEVNEPVAVRYGWSNFVDGSLFNVAGLPASSFRTDQWELDLK